MSSKSGGSKKNIKGEKVIADNRKANYLFSIEEVFEAGIVLLGSEVKSLRKDERNETATMVSDVRSVLDQYKSSAEIFLGGVPMITVDMIDYIQNDIQLFGLLILMFLVIALLVIFKNPQWMIVSMVCCLIGLMIMTGVLGYMSWPVTVVSANFVALLLIFRAV